MQLRFPFAQPAVVAHRGAHCCGHHENSLAAIAHAVELGAPGIEIDVCNLADGVLVISHDACVTIAGASIPLPALTQSEVGSLLRSGELMPVETALDLIRPANTFLCLDWKGNGDEAKVVRRISEFGLGERTIVSSLQSEALAEIKDRRPNLLTGLSIPSRSEPQSRFPIADDHILDRVRAARADAAMLERGLASPTMVTALRESRAGIFVWIAEDADTFASLANLGPDGIMSDAVHEHLGSG
ncbi:MAG TPA: glycerophosphodiester phosphodiesterase [Candidatus Dormibacteraeota bacterium]|nr:glycerophosphodiester phosphodiesterase [Candidatus Dormibacteraeota bacterium]